MEKSKKIFIFPAWNILLSIMSTGLRFDNVFLYSRNRKITIQFLPWYDQPIFLTHYRYSVPSDKTPGGDRFSSSGAHLPPNTRSVTRFASCFSLVNGKRLMYMFTWNPILFEFLLLYCSTQAFDLSYKKS